MFENNKQFPSSNDETLAQQSILSFGLSGNSPRYSSQKEMNENTATNGLREIITIFLYAFLST